jgi:hypothetical protein
MADVTVKPPGQLLFRIGPEGTVEHVAPEILDEVAAVLWDQIREVRMTDLGYGGDSPLSTRHAADQEWLRARAKDALTPLLRRLIQVRSQA